jgi:hypothetical protein
MNFRMRLDAVKKFLALLLRQLLRIIQPAKTSRQACLQPAGGKNDCRCDYRPRQGAATRFIHTGDAGNSLFPEFTLMCEAVPIFSGHGFSQTLSKQICSQALVNRKKISFAG